MRKCLGFILIVGILWLPLSAESVEVRIKDVADVQGIAANQLIGFGVVAGLPGTGDSNRTIVASQSIINMLSRMGLQISLNELQANNAAAVVVTAEIPSFAREGDRIDVHVASIGDARQIAGGLLLLTPLRGADGHVYASAQGRLELEKKERTRGRSLVNPTGKILSGGLISRDVPEQLSQTQMLSLRAHDPDFMTVALITKAINEALGADTALAVDDSTVMIRVPAGFQKHLVDFIATIHEIRVTPDVPARVVINERTGTVIISEKVRISKVAIAHGDMLLEIADIPEQGSDLQDVIRALNAVGTTPRDLVEILKLMKAAGALQAEIIVM